MLPVPHGNSNVVDQGINIKWQAVGPTELDHNHQWPIRINETKTSQTNHPATIHCDVASTDLHQASVADGVLETQIQWSYRIAPRAPLSFPAEGAPYHVGNEWLGHRTATMAIHMVETKRKGWRATFRQGLQLVHYPQPSWFELVSIKRKSHQAVQLA